MRSRRRERAIATAGAGAARGPLFGIPVLLKDNMDTATCRPRRARWRSKARSRPTTRSSPRKLREAGAIILGKATLTEFANFIAIGMPSGYSSLGGYGLNPYDPRPDLARRSTTGGPC